MKKILTSNITDEARLPLLKRTLDLLNENSAEVSSSAIYSIFNSLDDSVPIIVYGVVGTFSTVGFSNDTLTVTAGAVLYNGEIYRVAAGASTRADISKTHYLSILSTQQTGEPTKYTDDSEHITNVNRTVKIDQGTSGGGIVDWVNVKRLNNRLYSNATINGSNPIFTAVRNSGSGSLTGSSVQAFNGCVTKRGGLTHINGNLSITASSTGLSFSDIILTVSDFAACDTNSQAERLAFSGTWFKTGGENGTCYISFEDETDNQDNKLEIRCYGAYTVSVSDVINIQFAFSYKSKYLS